MFNYEDVKVKFTGEGNRIDFDRVVYERNYNTLKDMPDKEIVKLVYELRTSTAEQIRAIISKKFGIKPGKVDERLKKLVALRLITRYQFVITANGSKVTTANMYMLDVNGKNWLEGEEMMNVEWSQKDNLAIKTYDWLQFAKDIRLPSVGYPYKIIVQPNPLDEPRSAVMHMLVSSKQYGEIYITQQGNNSLLDKGR